MKTSRLIQFGLATAFGLVCGGLSANPTQMAVTRSTTQSPKITTIRLWNNDPDERILLRSDGTASYFGLDARNNPGIGEYRGTFPPEEFQRLAQAFTARGFFQLREQYTVPDTVSASLYSIAVGSEWQPEKLVYTNGGCIPAALGRLKAAIRDAAAKATWQKGPSGVRGVLVLQSGGPISENATVAVMKLNGVSGTSEIAFPVDKSGHFEMPLPPGSYRLRPDLQMRLKPGQSVDYGLWQVTVLPNTFLSLELTCKPVFDSFRIRRG